MLNENFILLINKSRERNEPIPEQLLCQRIEVNESSCDLLS